MLGLKHEPQYLPWHGSIVATDPECPLAEEVGYT